MICAQTFRHPSILRTPPWAGVFLMPNPEADANEFQAMIKASGAVILREDDDLPKLEAIVER